MIYAGRVLTALTFCAALALAGAAAAQTSTPAPATPAPSAPATPPSTTPPTPGAAQPADNDAAPPFEVKARPAVAVSGAAKWEDGYKAITAALAKARAAVLKANLKEAGRPVVAFVDTDDDNFKFQAMIPLDAPVAATVDLGPDAKPAETPAGRAIKFQHRGAYDDVDATYEAITAYLDEKGYIAQNIFVEEYLNDAKGADDSALEMSIYVFIK
ncbi:MAG: GyrI-like domain-containing protein [Rhodoblastus sp.]|nr:GyrI-like domain-containing protein [Rhodoblastus sp.]MCB9997556.1 GyrI-like domain-containing protein [Methylobacteriaceae bacterium]MCC2100458.1 GyrI-like domain-containing protein [Hyphomicrobiales bacterium]MCO5088748.1 GyrI-like domain-containing protein [Methylobacteriaceae bacterium]